jgi:transcription-repair coupling factor (superfamily II helicase)
MSKPNKFSGLLGASSAYWIAKHCSRALIVLPPEMPTKDWLNALAFFKPEAKILEFPHFERGFDPLRPQFDIGLQRLKVQNELLHPQEDLYLVTNPVALSQKVIAPTSFKKSLFKIEKNQWVDRELFVRFLKGAGYIEESNSNDRGMYSVRGHLIDFFDPIHEHPIRVEFFGDEVISLRYFDAESQRSLNELSEIEICPCREFSIHPDAYNLVFQNLKKLSDGSGISPADRTELFWKIENQRDFMNTRVLLPALGEPLVDIRQYLRSELKIVFINSEDAKLQSQDLWLQEDKAFETGLRLSYPLDQLRAIPTPLWEEAPELSIDEKIKPETEIVEILTHENLRSRLVRSKGFQPLLEEVRRLKDDLYEISVTVQDPRRREAIQDALGALCEGVQFRSSKNFVGFQSKALRIAYFTDRDIFGSTRKRAVGRSRISAADFLKEFSGLSEGDYIVHEEHGVGRYLGLKTLSVGNSTSEFAQIEYADSDKLYLPIYRLDQLSRFVKGDGYAEPRLDRLGSKQFIKKKQSAKEDILRIAHELIEIAAHRRLVKMEREQGDDSTYQSFCHDFPYELTPDQEAAVQEIEKDLSSPQPMDRLICGDVGFGKTEVALRAMMLRLLQSSQVAILAPTTLLVEQHYNGFVKRFGPYGFRVERLSRFLSKAQQDKILKDLKAGQIDVMVGTHRLLQKDIEFPKLGLLVVDEEQRFGVKHKEKIKNLKKSLDVLTLSATPIPRTLQMSIAGIKELSLIVTPPESREAVQTSVGFFEEKLIREACLRELSRQGQVFFVHNRVQSIQKFTENLRKLIPEAKIEFAHGQMKEDELENRMLHFMNHQFDILVATSIIENGIDVSNANTLLVDHAENFGLSDLYQIRGRVGRSNRKAYAYFLIHENTVLTEEASKRLQVIQNCSELGSGFRVATHDLEIRGSGNLLGEEQSGVIAEIGLELYNQMLLESLEEIKKSPVSKEKLPEMNFSLSAYIPDHYIPDPSLRVATYRRLNRLETTKELVEFESELLDRFGLYPSEVENLSQLTQLRIFAHSLSAETIDVHPGRLILAFRPSTPLEPTKILKAFGKKIHFDTKGRLIFKFDQSPPGDAEASDTESKEKKDLRLMRAFLKELAKVAGLPLD